MDHSEQIKNHIARGESDKAIKMLLEFTKLHRPKSHDEALLLSGQYRQWKREITLGIQHTNNELRRIEMGVIDILNEEETYESTPATKNRLAATPSGKSNIPQAQKSNLTSILLGVFGTISVAFILMLLISPDDIANADNHVDSSDVYYDENAEQISEQVKQTPSQQPERAVFGGGLTESQFNNQLSNYQKNTKPLDPARFDISTVIQVRYHDGEKDGFFESVAGTNEWIERGSEIDDIKARYEEVDRNNRTITLKDMERNRTRFLSIDDDKVYEQVETYPKFHVFNIIGVL